MLELLKERRQVKGTRGLPARECDSSFLTVNMWKGGYISNPDVRGYRLCKHTTLTVVSGHFLGTAIDLVCVFCHSPC